MARRNSSLLTLVTLLLTFSLTLAGWPLSKRGNRVLKGGSSSRTEETMGGKASKKASKGTTGDGTDSVPRGIPEMNVGATGTPAPGAASSKKGKKKKGSSTSSGSASASVVISVVPASSSCQVPPKGGGTCDPSSSLPCCSTGLACPAFGICAYRDSPAIM